MQTLIFYIKDSMLLVSTTTNCKKASLSFFRYFLSFFLLLSSQYLKAQENSPFSRYGFGNLVPGQNVVNRAMGGLSAPYYDIQSVNFVNPASYARLKVTTFDVGVDYDSRTLKVESTASRFKSAYMIPSYLQLGLPLSQKKNWGMNIGLRPVTRINYDVLRSTRLAGIDSVSYLFKGNGGSYQAFAGMGFGSKSLSVGFNVGYMFGSKEYATQVVFRNDTVLYNKSNSTDSTRFGGLFANVGLQYTVQLSKTTHLKIGATGNFKNSLNATRDISRETFEASASSGIVVVDSVYRKTGEKGKIIYPASFGFGVMYEKADKWSIGAEYSTSKWEDYRYYNQADSVQNSWAIRLGGQFVPDVNGKNYWAKVVYRFGFYAGPDYIRVGSKLPQYGITAGFGFPVRRNAYTNQYTVINTSFEYGSRGNKSNAVRESLFRVSVGLTLSDIWFIKRKYD